MRCVLEVQVRCWAWKSGSQWGGGRAGGREFGHGV